MQYDSLPLPLSFFLSLYLKRGARMKSTPGVFLNSNGKIFHSMLNCSNWKNVYVGVCVCVCALSCLEFQIVQNDTFLPWEKIQELLLTTNGLIEY